MVLQEYQTEVPLKGAGFKAHKHRGYALGEFRRLNNCELLDEKIVNRRSINAFYANDDIAEKSIDLTKRPIGFYRQWTILAGNTEASFLNAYSAALNMSVRVGDNPSINAEDGVPCGFHEYNHRCYWIKTKTDETSFDRSIYVDDVASPLTGDVSEITTGLVEENAVITEDMYSVFYNNLRYIKSFIHKERLWILTPDTLYFSKATDPAEFDTEEGGGFFRVEGRTFVDCIAHQETIYLLCEDALYTVTYSSDPNNDAEVRSVSTTTGGSSICVFQGNIFIINTYGLFGISNNSIEKVYETDFDEGPNNYESQKIYPYQDYIIINKTRLVAEDMLHPSDPASDYGVRINLAHNSSFEDGDTGYTGDRCLLSTVSPLDLDSVHGDKVLQMEYNYGSESDYMSVSNSYTINVRAGQIYAVSTYTANMTQDSIFVPSFEISVDAGDVELIESSYFDAAPTEEPEFEDDDEGDEGEEGDDGDPEEAPEIDDDVDEEADDEDEEEIPNEYAWIRPYVIFKPSEDAELTVTLNINPYVDEEDDENDPPLLEAGDQYYVDAFMVEPLSYVGDYFDSSMTDYAGVQFLDQDGSSVRWGPLFNYYENSYPYLESPEDRALIGNKLGYNTFFLNMGTGALHTVTYNQPFIRDHRYLYTFIADFAVNPYISETTNTNDLLVIYNSVDSDYTQLELGNVAYMSPYVTGNSYDTVKSSYRDEDIDDFIYTNYYIKPEYDIEIDGFTPDETEYVIKKFRNLQVMGTFPYKDMILFWAYDNMDYDLQRPLVDSHVVEGKLRLPVPHRVGLNQRGRAISIRFRFSNIRSLYDMNITDGEYMFMEITNIMFLWAPTKRAPETAGFSGSMARNLDL